MARRSSGDVRQVIALVTMACLPLPAGAETVGQAETLAAAERPALLRETLDDLQRAGPAPLEIWAARQWISAMEPRLASFIADGEQRRELLQRLYQEARLAGLAPELVLAVIEVESAFRADAVSSAGAVGLMQIMPFWIRELGLPADDLKHPWRNLRYGCTILAHYLAVERGDLTRALARYNGSLGETWYPERVLNAWQRHWRVASSVSQVTVR
ncbi:MAG: lytic transglycosylase domain-containing protein [Pseudomonadota bacterium]